MKWILQRFVIYLLIIVSVFAIMILIPGYKQEISPVGNVLSSYFYKIHSNTKEDIASAYEHHFRTLTDPELKKLYQALNWDQQRASIDYQSARDTTWQLYNEDGSIRTNYLEYWQAVRPTLREFFTNNIQPTQIYIPVVHFRCSDAPFVAHPMYHLTKADTVNWMAKQIKARGFNKVIMLSCNRHRRLKNNTCAKLADYYADIFKSNDIKVQKQCHSIVKDLALMIQTPLLVALNASSYSFIAGIAKDPEDFISCNLGREHEGKYLMHTQGDWIQDTSEPLLHSQVDDYYDVNKILSKLNGDLKFVGADHF